MQNLYQPFYKASSTKDRVTLSELRNFVFIELMSRDQTELLKATSKPKRYYMYRYCKIWNLLFFLLSFDHVHLNINFKFVTGTCTYQQKICVYTTP